jgi:hypothetical protein
MPLALVRTNRLAQFPFKTPQEPRKGLLSSLEMTSTPPAGPATVHPVTAMNLPHISPRSGQFGRRPYECFRRTALDSGLSWSHLSRTSL